MGTSRAACWHFLSTLSFRLLILGLISLGTLQKVGAQCASCKAAASSKDESGELIVGGGLNAGILFLLAMPFLISGVIAIIWLRRKKRLDIEQQIQ